MWLVINKLSRLNRFSTNAVEGRMNKVREMVDVSALGMYFMVGDCCRLGGQLVSLPLMPD